MAHAHLAELGVLNNSAIAAKLFLKVFDYLAVAEFLLQPLDRGKAFPTIALLYTYVDIFLCPSTRVL